jgi:ubiquinone/menaquinone biosynthesis C-methylase UbiE
MVGWTVPCRIRRKPTYAGAGGDVIVARAGIEPGMNVLDVACGTGNATIPAAKLEARVIGLAFSPGLIAIARERGAESDVEIEWLEGDAQALPYDDESYDRVISAIGHMFAPDHQRTAEEMRRVCRSNGRIAIACWTPKAASAGCSRLSARYRLHHRRALSHHCCGALKDMCANCSVTLSNSRDTPSSSRSHRPGAVPISC